MTTRRDIIKGGAGLAAILAAGKAPAYVRSMWGARNALMAGKRSQLPYDSEVEYLESTGTQWIDLDVNSTTDGFCDYDITFQCTGSGGSRLIPFGYQYGGTARYASWAINNATWGIGVNNSAYISVSADNNLHTIRVRNGQFVEVDGTQTTIGTGTVRANIGMGLFVRNQSASGLSTSSMTIIATKIYGFKLYDSNGNLVQDCIPVRKSGVGYIYDRVSGQLFGNAGTGAFGYGGDLNAHLYDDSASILMWDGIENIGYGVHDDAAAAWQDLIRADKSITINGQTWGSNCLDFYNSPMLYSANWTPAFEAADPLTIEAVISTDAVSNTTSYGLAAVAIGGTPASFIRIFYVQSAGSNRLDVFWGNVRQWAGLATLPVGPTTVTITRGDYDGEKFTYNLYVNGVLFATQNVAYSALAAGLSLSGFYNKNNVWPSNTHLRIHAVRMSSRAFTAAEVARRAMIDKRRFGVGG